jgi:hypothetical protein
MSARTEYRAARERLDAEATVTLQVVVHAADGTSVSEAWPDSWRGVALHDVTDSGLIMDEVCELADRAAYRLRHDVLGPEPSPTPEEAAQDEARRARQEADFIAQCERLGIDPHHPAAPLQLLKATLDAQSPTPK